MFPLESNCSYGDCAGTCFLHGSSFVLVESRAQLHVLCATLMLRPLVTSLLRAMLMQVARIHCIFVRKWRACSIECWWFNFPQLFFKLLQSEEAIQFMQARGYSLVTFEMDCKGVVDKIRRSDPDESEIEVLLFNIAGTS